MEGAVAQLGERLVCNQEVVGSNPIGSTRVGGLADRMQLISREARGRLPAIGGEVGFFEK